MVFFLVDSLGRDRKSKIRNQKAYDCMGWCGQE